MAQFNPDLLLKDELSYEALLRGLPYSDITVAELRKTLRKNRPDKPSLLNRLSVSDFESERETCYHKYKENMERSSRKFESESTKIVKISRAE